MSRDRPQATFILRHSNSFATGKSVVAPLGNLQLRKYLKSKDGVAEATRGGGILPQLLAVSPQAAGKWFPVIY